MNHHPSSLVRPAAALAVILALSGFSLDAAAWGVHRFERQNAAGGTTAGVTRHGAGPNGGAFAQRRVIRSDGEGNGVASSGSAWRTPAGGSGARGGTTTHSADGSMQHESGVSSSGPQGSVQSQGGFTRDAAGDVTQSRSTTATNAATGNSYQGSTSYSKDTGVVHQGTCMDAAGNTISCPGR